MILSLEILQILVFPKETDGSRLGYTCSEIYLHEEAWAGPMMTDRTVKM